MISPLPSLTEKERNILHNQLKVRPHQHKEIPDYINPHKTKYWIISYIAFELGLAGRFVTNRYGGPRLLYAMALVSIPAFALWSTAKLDKSEDFFGHRKTLDERLDLSPLTRRAWRKALESNNHYQEGLREQIRQLQKEVDKLGSS